MKRAAMVVVLMVLVYSHAVGLCGCKGVERVAFRVCWERWLRFLFRG